MRLTRANLLQAGARAALVATALGAACGADGRGAASGWLVHAGGGDGISTLRLDPATGALTFVERHAAGDDARLGELDPGGKRVWVQSQRGRPLVILTYDIGADGRLRPAGAGHQLPFPDVEGVTQLLRHPRAPWLLVSATNASAGLEDQLFPIADGQLGLPRIISHAFYAFGWDAAGSTFYGLDGEALFQSRFDAATGVLTALDPPAAPGSAGRTLLGLAQHAAGELVVGVEESTLSVYRREPATGALAAVTSPGVASQVGNPVPGEPITWSAATLHPRGRILYVTGFVTATRTLAIDVFTLDPETGALTFVEREQGHDQGQEQGGDRHRLTSTGLQAPLIRGGEGGDDWLLVGGQGTVDELWGRAVLAAYRIAPADGRLAPTGGVVTVAPDDTAATARVNFLFAP